MTASDFGDDVLEAVGESLGLGLEIIPAVLKLALASVVNVLPVVIDDQTGDFDVVFGELINGIKDFLIREPLAESVPGA